MIVLANRPGWPFLGNNFFQECGDLFSVLAIENPDQESEIEMLKSYAPDVPLHLLVSLSSGFEELRKLYQEGMLTYPYSTREIVSLVKHLQNFPNDRIESVLENVFDFEVHNENVKSHIRFAFEKHGFKLSNQFMTTDGSSKLASGSKGPLRVEYQSDNAKPATMPKHGKIDPHNTPHVGGNTWAGGTGGRDTAGLGGKGGPYRLDAGHDVHQISDEEKKNVSKEAMEQARAMAKEALNKVLSDIHMSSYESEFYEKYLNNVQRQIMQLRVTLDGLESKKKERKWVKNQITGDIDDNRLIEGVVGEKRIYKRRIEQKIDANFDKSSRPLPKRILFVMDTSASMYRFEGYDRRLTKMLETAVLIMESFQGFEQSIHYGIYGHNGDDPQISLVPFDRPPKDRRGKFLVLKNMIAMTQYCSAGDYTLEATKAAIELVTKEEAEQYFVFVLSDANLERYWIDPKDLSGILTSDPAVQGYSIFIASLGDNQARRLVNNIKPGHGFLCLDTNTLPTLFNKLLTTACAVELE